MSRQVIQFEEEILEPAGIEWDGEKYVKNTMDYHLDKVTDHEIISRGIKALSGLDLCYNCCVVDQWCSDDIQDPDYEQCMLKVIDKVWSKK